MGDVLTDIRLTHMFEEALELTAAIQVGKGGAGGGGGELLGADTISPDAFGVLCDRYGIVPFRRAAASHAGGSGGSDADQGSSGGAGAAGGGRLARPPSEASMSTPEASLRRPAGGPGAPEATGREADFDFAPLRRARASISGGAAAEADARRASAESDAAAAAAATSAAGGGGGAGGGGDVPRPPLAASGMGRRRSSISNLQALAGKP